MVKASVSLSVVSVRGLAPRTPGIVYVGRACAGWPASPLGNPFKRAVVGSKEVTAEARTFRFVWSYNGVSLKLAGFGRVKKDDKGEAS